VKEPVGKIASTLSLSGYVSYTKTSIFDLIQDVIHSHFHNIDEILIKSEPTVLFSAALEEARKKGIVEDFAIIRVNEILTHIQIVRNGHIKELGTVPIGLNSLLKGIAEACSVTLEVAINVLELYFQGKLESKFSQKLQQAIETTLEHWRIGIKEFVFTDSNFTCTVYASCIR
jgi:cell division ATPase FtsA